MAEIAVIGDSEFALGFELIGIKKIVEAESRSSVFSAFSTLMKEDVGIIVTNDKTIEKLDANFRRSVENSVTPIVVILSEKAVAQDNLRELIKKAIGIDILSK
jgi:V/A-type H+/Na+-transporting ATPase subunit F